MLFKFKIIFLDTLEDKEEKLLGMFGDCIKIRLYKTNNPQFHFQEFIAKFLGINLNLIEIKDFDNHSNILLCALPDQAYEIIMSWIN